MSIEKPGGGEEQMKHEMVASREAHEVNIEKALETIKALPGVVSAEVVYADAKNPATVLLTKEGKLPAGKGRAVSRIDVGYTLDEIMREKAVDADVPVDPVSIALKEAGGYETYPIADSDNFGPDGGVINYFVYEAGK